MVFDYLRPSHLQWAIQVLAGQFSFILSTMGITQYTSHQLIPFQYVVAKTYIYLWFLQRAQLVLELTKHHTLIFQLITTVTLEMEIFRRQRHRLYLGQNLVPLVLANRLHQDKERHRQTRLIRPLIPVI